MTGRSGSGLRPLAIAATSLVALAGVLSVLLLAFTAMLGGAQSAAACQTSGPPVALATGPVELRTIFTAAADHYQLGGRGPAILAALTEIESGFGANLGPSSAGAVGWTQFLPSTWRRYGVDADGDGTADPNTAVDAIYGAANYLDASGAPQDWYRALFTYNHSDAYVSQVLNRADYYATAGLPADDVAASGCGAAGVEPFGVRRVTDGGRPIAIPGQTGIRVDERILADVTYLIAAYHVRVTAGYALTGHASDGEHPLGLAVDIAPGPDGTWDDIDRLAAWAEPTQDAPRPPFRWVGYNGDQGHGRGNHLHLSWNHAPTALGQRPSAWVDVMSLPGR